MDIKDYRGKEMNIKVLCSCITNAKLIESWIQKFQINVQFLSDPK